MPRSTRLVPGVGKEQAPPPTEDSSGSAVGAGGAVTTSGAVVAAGSAVAGALGAATGRWLSAGAATGDGPATPGEATGATTGGAGIAVGMAVGAMVGAAVGVGGSGVDVAVGTCVCAATAVCVAASCLALRRAANPNPERPPGEIRVNITGSALRSSGGASMISAVPSSETWKPTMLATGKELTQP